MKQKYVEECEAETREWMRRQEGGDLRPRNERGAYVEHAFFDTFSKIDNINHMKSEEEEYSIGIQKNKAFWVSKLV